MKGANENYDKSKIYNSNCGRQNAIENLWKDIL